MQHSRPFCLRTATGYLILVGSALGAGACSDTTTNGGTALDDVVLQSFDTQLTGKDSVSAKDGATVDGSEGGTDATSTDAAPGDAPSATCVSAGGAWCPCSGNGDCDSGICLDTPVGQVCAAKCVDSCPGDYTCATVNTGGGDVQSICVPKWGWLCDPCMAGSDCTSPGVGAKAACLDYGDVGRFCGFDCASAADCPTGYTCAEGKTVDGATRKQCRLPAGETCDCSIRATALQAATSCASKEATTGAICTGKRHCEATGLTACDAKASVEICNGLDDDCDGMTDAGSCDDKNACTQDNCDPKTGACGHKALDGTPCDDGNPCTDNVCNVKSGECGTAYNSDPCDDGNPCSQNDKCGGGVCKAGSAVDCVDNDACTVDNCDVGGGGCKHTVSTGVCDDGDKCSYGETCASGACTGGQNLQCDDLNPCTADSCQKATGCVHNPQNGACNDGNACTENDACAGGSCVGAQSPPCTSDLNTCTDDICDPTVGCVYPNNSLPCSDGSVCTQVDACSQGACVGGSPLNCTDDGNPCTTESCNPVSGCVSVNNAAACDDNDPCTLGDACSAGNCKGGLAKDCSAMSGVCGVGKCADGACYQEPFAIKTVCPTGLCDGAGVCEPQVAQTIDGCTKEPTVDYFQDCSTWGCFGCVEQTGFSAYNITDCAGAGCFDRFPTFGVKGMIVMLADWEQSAHVDWKFAKPLIGNYTIEAAIPPAIPANSGSCTPGQATYNTAAKYHLITAGGELGAPITVNHSAKKNSKVTLFSGDATGLTGIRLYNGPSASQTQPPACEFYLVDAVYATPQ